MTSNVILKGAVIGTVVASRRTGMLSLQYTLPPHARSVRDVYIPLASIQHVELSRRFSLYSKMWTLSAKVGAPRHHVVLLANIDEEEGRAWLLAVREALAPPLHSVPFA